MSVCVYVGEREREKVGENVGHSLFCARNAIQLNHFSIIYLLEMIESRRASLFCRETRLL